MYELMTFEDFLIEEEKARDPRVKARKAFEWAEYWQYQFNPLEDEDFYNIPTFIRNEVYSELYPLSLEVKYQ